MKLTAPVRCCSRMAVRRNAMPCHGVVGMLRRGGMLWRGAAPADMLADGGWQLREWQQTCVKGGKYEDYCRMA